MPAKPWLLAACGSVTVVRYLIGALFLPLTGTLIDDLLTLLLQLCAGRLLVVSIVLLTRRSEAPGVAA